MKLLKLLFVVALVALLVHFGREVVNVFGDEDLAFLHYLW